MRRWGALPGLLLLGAAPAPGVAEMEVRLAPDGVRVLVSLDRTVTRFAFAPADTVRADGFRPLTPGLRLEGDALVAAAPFRRFELLIRPMTQERDAKYPAHYRVGKGGMVYTPALRADEAAWTTRLSFRTAAGEVRLPASGPVEDGFVFLGPAATVRDGAGLQLVADPAAPSWLVERSRAGLAAAVAGYGRALGAGLPRKPLLVVSHRGGPGLSNVGDVTPGAVTTLRFQGDGWLRPDEEAAREVQRFVLHEAFHFWNGELARPAADAPAWLHEGGAEYAALLAGLAARLWDDGYVAARLGEALTRCRTALDRLADGRLGAGGFLPANLRYPCGAVLQWAADLRLRRASGGRRTVLHAWADLIRSRDPAYGLVDFHRAAEQTTPPARWAERLLVEEGGTARWAALAAALRGAGADVAEGPDAQGRRNTILLHLLRLNCRAGGGYGFDASGGRVRLDAPPGCGALAGDATLASVEGGDPFAPTAETFAAVARRCAARLAVRLRTTDGRELLASCPEPLPPAPPTYTVRRWRAA